LTGVARDLKGTTKLGISPSGPMNYRLNEAQGTEGCSADGRTQEIPAVAGELGEEGRAGNGLMPGKPMEKRSQ